MPTTLRTATFACSAFLLFALLPWAGAQAPITDPAGDVTLNVYDTSLPTQGWEAVDLRELQIEESEDELVFTLTLEGDSGAPDDAHYDDATAWIAFRHGGHRFAIEITRDLSGETNATLHALELPGPTPRTIAGLPLEDSGASAAVRVPRDLLRDEQGAPAMAGSVLEELSVVTVANLRAQGLDPERGFFCCRDAATVTDRMPDDGSARHAVATGGRDANGTMLLSSRAPFAAVNDGGQVVRFDLEVDNAGEPRNATLRLVDLPAEWEARLTPEIHLPSGRTNLTVHVQTGPGHRHNVTNEFTARVEDEQGQWATALLGVHWLAVPQPTGHHFRLFLHSRPEANQFTPILQALGYAPGALVMNTLLEDPDDADVPVDSTHSEFGGGQSRWSICLVPGPAVPFAFNTTSIGSLEVHLSAERPYGEVVLSGELRLYGLGPAAGCDADALAERDPLVMGRVEPVGPKQVAGATAFQGTFVPTQEAGHVPHVPGSVLLLELVADYPVPDSQAPGPLALEPGGALFLPLVDPAPDRLPAPTGEPPAPSAAPEEQPAETTPTLPALVVVAAFLTVLARRRR